MQTFLAFKSLEILPHLERYIPDPPPGICDFGRLLAKRIDSSTPMTGKDFCDICRNLAQDLMGGRIVHNLANRPEAFYVYLLSYAPLIAKIVFHESPQVSEETQIIMVKRKSALWS